MQRLLASVRSIYVWCVETQKPTVINLAVKQLS